MPGNWVLDEKDCHQLYAYINSLKNQGKEEISGDPVAGENIFIVSGCASCHIVKGTGSSIGPELTQIGAGRNAAYLRQSILEPGAALPESTDPDNGYGFSLYLPVKLKTADGKEISGLRMNEDTYTIQLKDISNHYYSFEKDKLVSFEKMYGTSLMPDYKNKLTGKQVEDLVAYLSKLGNQ
jgi:putative heme-binding domain-containing protein